MNRVLEILAAGVLLAAGANALAAGDPFDGDWKIDLARSQTALDPSHTEPRPTDMTIRIRTQDGTVQYDSRTTYDNGRISQMHYSARYDGSLALVTGTMGLMSPLSLKRIDTNTVEASYHRGLQVVATSRRVISDDGKSMTITTTSADAEGKNTSSVHVFMKSGGGDPPPQSARATG